MDVIIESGPDDLWRPDEDRGTCIWHLMSSIGVSSRLVNAPLVPPQAIRAFNESGMFWSGCGKVAFKRDCAMR